MKINLNESVKVKLTAHGRAVHFVHVGITLPPTDEDGFTQFQLHTLMHEFGDALYPGAKNSFEDCEIHLITSTQTDKERIKLFEREVNELTKYLFQAQNTATIINNQLTIKEKQINIIFSPKYICTFQNVAAYVAAAKKILRGES